MLNVVKMMLKGEVGGCALNSHGNYMADPGKSWKNHGIVFFKFLLEPCFILILKRLLAHPMMALNPADLATITALELSW